MILIKTLGHVAAVLVGVASVKALTAFGVKGVTLRRRFPLLDGHLALSVTKTGIGHAFHFGRWSFGHSARGVKYGSAHVWRGLSQRWYS